MARPAMISRMSEAEYLAYELGHEGKHELVNGEVLAMSGVSEAHSLIQANLTIALGTRLRGGPCRVYTSDLRVLLEETGMYCYPDLSVVCGAAQFVPTRPETLLNPRLVIEVLSESSEDYDRGAKAAHYRHRATIETLLFVDSRRRLVEMQRRNPDGTWTLSEHTTGSLPVVDIELPLDEIYEGVLAR